MSTHGNMKQALNLIFFMSGNEIIICDSKTITKQIKKYLNCRKEIKIGDICFWKEAEAPEFNNGSRFSYWINEGKGNYRIEPIDLVIKIDESLKDHKGISLDVGSLI